MSRRSNRTRISDNFGWGTNPRSALRSATRWVLGDGRFSTRAAHLERVSGFCSFLAEAGISTLQQVGSDTVEAYAALLRARVTAGTLGSQRAQNLLSSLNVALSALRGDYDLWRSPSALVGRRSQVRRHPPEGLDPAAVERAAAWLDGRGRHREACVVRLARHLGVRRREAALLDAKAAYGEAMAHGEVSITRGTKGGRGKYVPRFVPASREAVAALSQAAALQGDLGNIIPADVSLKSFYSRLRRHWGRARRRRGSRQVLGPPGRLCLRPVS